MYFFPFLSLDLILEDRRSTKICISVDVNIYGGTIKQIIHEDKFIQSSTCLIFSQRARGQLV